MKLTADLLLGGKNIKDIGFPKDPNDGISRAYLETKIACWEGIKHYQIDSDETLQKIIGSIPRIGSGASIFIAIDAGNYSNIHLSLMDYDSVIINGFGAKTLGEYNILRTSKDRFSLSNLNGSNADLSNIKPFECRIRFSDHTPTTALRGFVANIIFKVVENWIVIDKLLPVPPGTEDHIYVEEPGVSIKNFNVNVWTFNELKISNIIARDNWKLNNPLSPSEINFCYSSGIIRSNV